MWSTNQDDRMYGPIVWQTRLWRHSGSCPAPGLTPSACPSRFSAWLLVVLMALTGCGGSVGPTRSASSSTSTSPRAVPESNRTSADTHSSAEPASTSSGKASKASDKSATSGWRPVTSEDASVTAAMAFLKEVSAGTPRLNQLTPAFVRLIGRPWELPADKDKGYSALAAESWLKRLGSGRTFAPPTGKVGPALALLHGSSTGPDQMAHYYLRLQLHAGQWQVDHFVVSSAALEVDLPEEEAALTAGFALQCWLAALADRQVLAPEDRAVLAAALLTPALRQQWAPPFDSDRAHGYDFNRGQLLLRLEPFSSAQRRFHLRPLDPPRHWQIEALLDKATSKRWVLMLEKMDDTPQWLITRLQETP